MVSIYKCVKELVACWPCTH